MLHPVNFNAIDEFELEADPGEEEIKQEEEELDDEAFRSPETKKILIVNRRLDDTDEEVINRHSRQYAEADDEAETLRVIVHGDGGEGLICPCCGGGGGMEIVATPLIFSKGFSSTCLYKKTSALKA